MILQIPQRVRDQLIVELKQAGTREIGGILLGEHVSYNTFLLCNMTYQRHGGTFARFTRLVQDIVNPLISFFKSTNRNYRRFNYIGEWHSHPSFSLSPSRLDVESILGILNDKSIGANFIALLIVKLDHNHNLNFHLTYATKQGRMSSGEVIIVQEN